MKARIFIGLPHGWNVIREREREHSANHFDNGGGSCEPFIDLLYTISNSHPFLPDNRGHLGITLDSSDSL
jgi:hypothetical protein